MKVVATALKTAGDKLPSARYRVWNWLKDHPEKTADEIQKALGLTYVPSTLMCQLEQEGVVRVFSDVTKRVNPVTKRPQKIKRYSVTSGKYEEPVRKKYQRKTTVHAEAKSIKPLLESPTPWRAVSGFNPETWVTGLSLTQAKELYVYLHGVFK